MNDNDYKQLYRKFLYGSCSDEELELLFHYFGVSEKEELKHLIRTHFRQPEDESHVDRAENERLEDAFFVIKSRIHTHQRSGSTFLPWGFIKYAAAILILLSIGIYAYKQVRMPAGQGELTAQDSTLFDDVLPGGNKATLMLADGQTIDLNQDKHGVVFGPDEITYTDGTKIGSNPSDVIDPNKYVKLITPRGGQYQVVLPDGSKVWLNAASSLEYPVEFSGNERRVTLTGEAYFEVRSISQKKSTNLKMPFIVETQTQEVKVLGTRFNINSYSDESAVKTTLIEGSVNVSIPSSKQFTILKPNQESSIARGSQKIDVVTIDPASAVAWKEGLFRFDNADIYTLMRKISRWYNIDVKYQGEVTYEPFYGEIQRSYNLSEVLNVLKLGGVEFQVRSNGDEKQIIVM